MQLEPGMRVRCLRADINGELRVGQEYHVERYDEGANYVSLTCNGNDWWWAGRFKPVVRVKAPCVPSLDLMVDRAVAAFNKLTPEQQDAHLKAQRESYVRGEMALSKMGLG